MSQSELTQERKSITELSFPGDDPDTTGWVVGSNCMAIIPYNENGQMALVPWLRVIGKDGNTAARMAAHHVLIGYN